MGMTKADRIIIEAEAKAAAAKLQHLREQLGVANDEPPPAVPKSRNRPRRPTRVKPPSKDAGPPRDELADQKIAEAAARKGFVIGGRS